MLPPQNDVPFPATLIPPATSFSAFREILSLNLMITRIPHHDISIPDENAYG
jgi:hypothetical protein